MPRFRTKAALLAIGVLAAAGVFAGATFWLSDVRLTDADSSRANQAPNTAVAQQQTGPGGVVCEGRYGQTPFCFTPPPTGSPTPTPTPTTTTSPTPTPTPTTTTSPSPSPSPTQTKPPKRGEPGFFASTVTIRYDKPSFKGQVINEKRRCKRGRLVSVFKAKKGRDRLIGSDTTSRAGNYSVRKKRARGRYYASVRRVVFTAKSGALRTCGGDRSVTIKIKR